MSGSGLNGYLWHGVLVQGGRTGRGRVLAQHSNFKTTMKQYAKASERGEAAALANLPGFAIATATNEAKVG